MKLIKIILMISNISLIFGLDLAGLKSTQEWSSIQKNEVIIKTTNYLGFPICNAETILPFPMKTISAIVENVEDYPNVFIRVSNATSLEKDIVHIMLDMPFPFAGRDYIIKYSKFKFGSKWTFKYSAIEHTLAPLQKNYIRLIHAAGEWKLTKIDSSKTRVSYTWNGELLGDFPHWALERAWIEQGNEMMNWLNDALKD